MQFKTKEEKDQLEISRKITLIRIKIVTKEEVQDRTKEDRVLQHIII